MDHPTLPPRANRHPCRVCGRLMVTLLAHRYPICCSNSCEDLARLSTKRRQPLPTALDHPAAVWARSVKQASERLGISQEGVRRLIRAGRLPAVRLGREWLIEEEAIVNYKSAPVGRPRKRRNIPNEHST